MSTKSGTVTKSKKSSNSAKSKVKPAKSGTDNKRSPSPGTLMRAHGHKLVQMWVSKQLQSAILDRARAKGVRISDVLRETVGKEAEKWSGAAVGSLQTLRFVSNGASSTGAGKNGAKNGVKSAKSAKSARPAAKPSAKPARKPSPRSSAARGGTKTATDVVATAGSGDAAAETVAE